jgi:hypothetical protein
MNKIRCAIILLLAQFFMPGGELAAQTPTNTWIEVSPPTSYPAGRAGRPEGRSNYGGIAYRPASGSILFYDGYVGEEAASSIYANTMASWDIAQNRVNALKITESAPHKRHTYEDFVYVDTKDAVYMMKGAWDHGCHDAADGLWQYTFSDNTWRSIPTNIAIAASDSHCEGHMAYWKAGGKLIYVDSTGRDLYEFNLSTQVWTKVTGTYNTTLSLYNAQSTWDSNRNLWVFWNRGLFAYDPVTRVFSTLPVSGSSPGAAGESGITYIPSLDAYMLAAGSGASGTWVYRNSTRSWQQISGAALPVNGELTHTYIQYDPGTDMIYAFQGVGRRFFKMRYVPPGGPPTDTTPPRAITDFGTN